MFLLNRLGDFEEEGSKLQEGLKSRAGGLVLHHKLPLADTTPYD